MRGAWIIGLLAFVGGLFCGPLPAPAQLNRETEQLFRELMPHLDGDLKSLFQRALDERRTWIEFTPDQLDRFRKLPDNPFDGLEAIDTQRQPGSVRLEFKIPSPRDRVPIRGERQHREHLALFHSTVARAAESTVELLADGELIALATVVQARGLALTKASEIEGRGPLRGRYWTAEGPGECAAALVRVDGANDLALVKLEAQGLTPAEWVDEPLPPGSFVIACDSRGRAVALGVVSTVKRSMIAAEQAHLGVRPVTGDRGVLLSEITPGGAAERAGLRAGDLVTHFGDEAVATVTDLVNAIRLRRPQEEIRLRYLRGGQPREIAVILDGRTYRSPPEDASEPEHFGALVSRRHDGFPLVFQHDAPLLPEQCGGPLVDLQGRIVGINIARAGRVASLAIGGREARSAVDRLTRENVADNSPLR